MDTVMSHFFISSRRMSLYISIADFDTAYAPMCSIATRPIHNRATIAMITTDLKQETKLNCYSIKALQ